MALDVRAATAQVVGDVLGGRSLNQALPPRLAQVAERDRGLLQQLSYGTLRQQPRLQGLLTQLLNKPLRDKDSDVQSLLLCGLYQLEDTRIPDHAAVAATVGAVATLKKPWARGMANAVLRRFLRERESLIAALDPAAAAAHPPWLYQALHQQWPEQAADIIAANNAQPPMTLRVNSRRMAREAYLEQLAAAGIEAAAGALSPRAICLASPCDVTALPGFSDGDVSVQDEAAQLAAALLPAHPGERVLDACAAPGGKACHLLEEVPELAELVAMDVDATRLARVTENLQRLALPAQLLTGDAGAPPASLAPASFDHILVDAPCSATGVIRRHPDVKVLRRPTDLDSLAAQQLVILHGLWPLLKPGGHLLYVTCSILAAENSAVVKRFLAEQSEAQLVQLDVSWGQDTGWGRQLLPAPAGADGLFFSLMSKQA
jgi:16S rRNA (cytosine967-C5)-methyltransferase